MNIVKSDKRSKKGPISERLAILLDAFSPWEGISLTYRQFAAELGAPLTEASVKKWPQRRKFPVDVARLIVAKARSHSLMGVTLEWVLWGDGPGPKKSLKTTHDSSVPEPQRVGLPAVPQEPHGHFAAQIAEALEADLGHNEFGQWSSVEVQHTVIWALKDLARRLWVLRFSMGETFKLTDTWAGNIGLPVRPREQAADAAGSQDAEI